MKSNSDTVISLYAFLTVASHVIAWYYYFMQSRTLKQNTISHYFLPGMSVPADARLVESIEVRADEALLTGESEEVQKELIEEDGDLPVAHNMIYMSTAINNGAGYAVVTTTGMNTQVGAIAKSLKESGSRLTPLQHALNRLGGLIGGEEKVYN